MGLIRFLIIFAAIYYGFKLLSRFVLPFLVQYLFKKAQRNMNDQFGAHHSEGHKQEGEITIKHSPDKKSRDNNSKGDAGEYIDFEEVE